MIQIPHFKIERTLSGSSPLRARLLGTAITGSLVALAGMASPAAAQNNACGAAVDGTVTCTPAGNPYPDGIQYRGSGGLTIVLQPDVVVNSGNAPGVLLFRDSGSTSSGVVTTADDVTITNNSSGIIVNTLQTTGGDATIDSGAAISTRFSGLSAFASGDATIANRGDITTSSTSSSSIGIRAFSSTGDTTITNSGAINVNTSVFRAFGILGSANAAGAQVEVTNSAAVVVNNSGTGGALGITAVSNQGSVRVTNSGSISTTGVNSIGILAVGDGDVNVVGNGSVRTSGDDTFGVLAFTDQGNVSVTTGAVSTTGQSSMGIAAVALDGTAVVNAASVSTQGRDSAGISASGSGGVAVTAGSVSTAGANSDGIFAVSDTGRVAVTAQNVSVSGTGGTGIFVRSDDDVVVNSGSASAIDRPAISAVSSSGSSTVTITGRTTSAQREAVVAIGGTTATVNVRAGGSVSGATNSITISGEDGTTVNNAGTITTGSGFAIEAFGGPATVINSGTITGRIALTGGNDVLNNSGTFNATMTSNLGAGNDAVTNSGTFNVTGGLNFGTGNDTLANSGTFNSNGAVNFGDGNDTLTNSGTFNSNSGVSFGGGNDTVNNSGVFNANSNTDFGAGTDTFNNSGTLRVLFGRPAGAVTMVGLEAFNNSGLIDLRNGRTGDSLSIPGTFTGSGGSQLGLDVTFGTPGASDRLFVGNAQGSTTILLNQLGGTPTLGFGPVLVQGSSASNANAFTLAPVQAGLVQVQLVYNPSSLNFSLAGTPSDAAFRTSAFAEAGRSLWHKSAEAWSAQMREGRDTMFSGNEAGEAGGRFWIQGYGSQFDRDLGGSFSAFGTTRDVDLSYNQDFFGGQVGFDFGSSMGPAGGFGFGVTGGYVDSHVSFAGGDDLQLAAANIGAYAKFAAGPFFINGLAKYDKLMDSSNRSIAGAFEVEMDGDAYGGMVEAGFRFGTTFFVEPMASLAYVNSDLDRFEVRGTSVAFDVEESVRGKAGARVGTLLPMGNGASGTLYGGAHYVHEFRGRDRVTLSSGGTTFGIDGRRIGDHVEGMLGLNIAGPGNMSGFFEANGSIDNDHEGFGGRAGLRFRF